MLFLSGISLDYCILALSLKLSQKWWKTWAHSVRSVLLVQATHFNTDKYHQYDCISMFFFFVTLSLGRHLSSRFSTLLRWRLQAKLGIAATGLPQPGVARCGGRNVCIYLYTSIYISRRPCPVPGEEKRFHKSAARYMCSQFPGSGH